MTFLVFVQSVCTVPINFIHTNKHAQLIQTQSDEHWERLNAKCRYSEGKKYVHFAGLVLCMFINQFGKPNRQSTAIYTIYFALKLVLISFFNFRLIL